MLNYDEIVTRSKTHRNLLLINAAQARLTQSLAAAQPHPISAWVGQQLIKWGRPWQSDKPMLVLPALLSHFSNLRLVRYEPTILPLLALLTLWFCLNTRPAAAATIPVDGTTCTLVAAIDAANNDAANGGCPAGNGADTITLLNDVVLNLVNNSSIGGNTGLPIITSAITIQGGGHTIRRASNASVFRLFYIASTGVLTLKQTTLIGGNSSPTVGGGIYNGGTVSVSNSTLSGNSATLQGGGIYNDIGRNVTMSNSTLSGNSAGSEGGCIYNGGTVSVSNSTLSGNSAKSGGCIFNSGTVSVSNSTLSGNTATFNGGGIFNFRNTMILDRSLIAGNNASTGREIYNGSGSTVNGNNYNLIGYDTDAGAFNFTPTGSDIVPGVGLALILAATLADNGGDMQTLALVRGSPAIDAAADSGLDTDQRGVSRPQGAADDIGAFEFIGDNTAPVITPQIGGTLGANNWYTSDVNVTWNVVDNESAISSQPGCDNQSITSDTSGLTFTCSATSAGGSSSESVTVKRDATAPLVTVTGVSSGASYALGSVPAAGCTTNDLGSGVATAAMLNVTGGNTDGTGAFTATCRGATDNAGNPGSASVTYSVVYHWSGFLQPVDNLPTVNTVNAGQGIPLKFSLGGNFGLAIFATGYPAWQTVNCQTGSSNGPLTLIETAGASALQYDPATQRYTYVWKTDKAWAGTCRQLLVRLLDGTDHIALFQFNGKVRRVGAESGEEAEEASEQPIRLFLPFVNR